MFLLPHSNYIFLHPILPNSNTIVAVSIKTVLSPHISISGVLLSAYLLSSEFTCFKIPILYIVPLHLYLTISFPFPLYPHVFICLLTQCGLESSIHVCTYALNSYFSLLPPHFPRRQSTPVSNSPWLTLYLWLKSWKWL